MRLPLASLGLKLNLSLLFLFLMVGAATAALILYGLNRTQDNATKRSHEALEQLGEVAVEGVVAGQASYGAVAIDGASEMGHRAASYLESFQKAGSQAPADFSQLIRAPNGALFNPDPNRISDVLIPAYVSITPAVMDDFQYSAALDALYPALFQPVPGSVKNADFNPIAIYFVSTNGLIRSYPSRSLNPITRRDVRLPDLLSRLGPENNPDRTTLWSTPFNDQAGKGLVVTAEMPVYQGDILRGAFQVELSLDNLIAQVDALRLTSIGFAFYIDADGQLMQSSSYDLVQTELDKNNEALRATIEAMRRREQHVDRVNINGHDMFVGYSPVQGFGGSLAVAASVDELTAEAARITSGIQDEGQRTLQITLIAMGLLFLIGLAGASYLNRRVLVRPIEALVSGTRAVAGGDLDARIPARGDDELATLARSFNEMTSQLRARSEALEAEVKEREAAQEELSALFAAMTDWVLVLDREGTFVRVPQTSAVTLLTDRENLAGMRLSDLLSPAQAEAMVTNIQRALAERKTFVEEYPVETPEGVHWFSSALSPISNDEVVVVARDITDRVNARQVLEKQVEERTQELRSLLDVSTDIASTLELAPLLDRIVDRIQDIAEYVRCTIFVAEGNRLVTLNSRSDNAQPIGAFTLNRDDVMLLWERLSKNEHLIIEDVLDDSELARLYRASVGDLLVTALQDVRCWMSVPLFWQDRVIGMLTLSHSERGHYTDRHASLVSGIATQVAVAIENARLYEDTQRAARENEALLRADAELFRSLSLDSVLQSLADVTVDVLQVDKSILTVAEGDRQRIGASRNVSEEGLARIGGRLSSLSFGVSDAPATFMMDDNETDTRPEPREIWAAEGIRSYVVVPIISGERTIGSFLAGYSQLHAFNPSEMRTFQALAERGAVAIQNAELYARSQQAASLEERQRLARELHDSVSQALYGIALGARTARTLLDRDPAKSVEPVDYVLSLAEAGLAEMRALIFELRPESLESEGLVAALDKQVAATSARHRIDVEADLGEEPALNLQEKEIFYRIGQEALHNVVKHSRASRASVRLANEGESIVLEVADNGGGFDPGESFPGHLGLVSMRERAATIGATLHIASAPGHGALVRLRLSRNGNGHTGNGNIAHG